jgi:hypothetical protein
MISPLIIQRKKKVHTHITYRYCKVHDKWQVNPLVLELNAWCTLQHICSLNCHSDCCGSWVLLESYCVLTVVDFWCWRFNWKHSSYYKQFRILAYFCKFASYVSLKMCSYDWYIGQTLWVLATLQKCCTCTVAGHRCFPLTVGKCDTSQK